MGFSYSGDPSSSDLDEVRFYLGDIDSTDVLLPDEEIQFVIDSWASTVGTNLYAAAVCAEMVAARFAREVSVSADGVSAGMNELQQKYNDLASSLREQHTARYGAAGSPSAGGTIFDEYYDSGIKPLSFGKGMHDNLRAGQQDYGGQQTSYPRDFPEDALQ